MALVNTFFFTNTIVDWDKFAKATGNRYRVVSVRPYSDKKNNQLPDGYTLTLQVVHDEFDYGDNKEGVPRESNLYQNFDVTVLNREHEIRKGDYVRLLDFDSVNSFAFGFDLILRFNDYEVLPRPTKTNAKS